MVEKFTGERKKGEHEAEIINKEPVAILEYRNDEERIPPKPKKGN